MAFNTALLRARAQRPAQSPYGTVAGVQGAQDQMIDEEGAYGKTASDAYLSRAQNFDASSALNKYSQGAWGSISSALGDQLTAETGKAVGAGRFDSGFFDEDKGVVINRATQQLSDSIAQQSLNAASLDQRNTESLGSFGSERAGRATDLLLSRSEQVQNDAREEAERKRKSRGGIAGAIGSVVGGIAGSAIPGLGNIAGSQLGGALGGYIGGR